MPFTPISVELYKRVRLAAERKQYLEQSFPFYMHLALHGGTICMLIGLSSMLLANFLNWSYVFGLATLASGFVGFGCATIWWSMLDSFYWEMISIENFMQPIPEFVAQTILDIHKQCPSVRFFIEAMGRCDPFLVVQDTAGNNNYVEVWNEPGFKQEREV